MTTFTIFSCLESSVLLYQSNDHLFKFIINNVMIKMKVHRRHGKSVYDVGQKTNETQGLLTWHHFQINTENLFCCCLFTQQQYLPEILVQAWKHTHTKNININIFIVLIKCFAKHTGKIFLYLIGSHLAYFIYLFTFSTFFWKP